MSLLFFQHTKHLKHLNPRSRYRKICGTENLPLKNCLCSRSLLPGTCYHKKPSWEWWVMSGHGGAFLSSELQKQEDHKFEVSLRHLAIFCLKIKVWWAGEVAQGIAVFAEDWVQFLAPTRWHTTVCGYYSGGSDAVFWPPLALGIHTVHINTCTQSIHTCKINRSLFKM